MSPVLIEPEAEREIRAAQDWYEAQREGLGIEFLDSVDEVVNRIGELPNACSLVPGVPGALRVRRAFLKRFPFAAIFVEHERRLAVVALAHLRRHPGYWLKRASRG